MSDLNAAFEAAVANSKNLSERPDNATLLKIYALYKQATVGDNTEKKPSFSDMVGRAKWDAWEKLKGTAADAAKQQYIDLITELSCTSFARRHLGGALPSSGLRAALFLGALHRLGGRGGAPSSAHHSGSRARTAARR